MTGASSNIGAATATRLARDGFAVAVNYRDQDTAEDARRVVETIRSQGGVAESHAADIADPTAVSRMVSDVTGDLGPPTVLVNNAAIWAASEISWLEITPEAWGAVQDVNVHGAFLCARAVYSGMVEAGGGSIINMSSVRALVGSAGNLHYTVSKAALIGLTRSLARALGPDNITVNALVVGAIRTPAESVYGPQEDVDRRMLDLQSIKRRGTIDDISEAVAFLASPNAGFISGQSIPIDGGWVMS